MQLFQHRLFPGVVTIFFSQKNSLKNILWLFLRKDILCFDFTSYPIKPNRGCLIETFYIQSNDIKLKIFKKLFTYF